MFLTVVSAPHAAYDKDGDDDNEEVLDNIYDFLPVQARVRIAGLCERMRPRHGMASC